MDGNPSVIRVEAEGPETSLYCGWLGVLSGKHPLLEALPPVIAIEAESDAANDWIESNLGYAAGELQYDAVLVAKLSDILFAKAVRRYVDGLGPTEGGWLAGLKDPGVARAMVIIHQRFAEELDVDELARAAGLSWTVLRDRFVELLGEPPMRYCAKWRMRAAPNMLRDGKDNSANIAYAVGFNSEAAFNRAFKREFGEPPANWRRRQKGGTGDPRRAGARARLSPCSTVRGGTCRARPATSCGSSHRRSFRTARRPTRTGRPARASIVKS